MAAAGVWDSDRSLTQACVLLYSRLRALLLTPRRASETDADARTRAARRLERRRQSGVDYDNYDGAYDEGHQDEEAEVEVAVQTDPINDWTQLRSLKADSQKAEDDAAKEAEQTTPDGPPEDNANASQLSRTRMWLRAMVVLIVVVAAGVAFVLRHTHGAGLFGEAAAAAADDGDGGDADEDGDGDGASRVEEAVFWCGSAMVLAYVASVTVLSTTRRNTFLAAATLATAVWVTGAILLGIPKADVVGEFWYALTPLAAAVPAYHAAPYVYPLLSRFIPQPPAPYPAPAPSLGAQDSDTVTAGTDQSRPSNWVDFSQWSPASTRELCTPAYALSHAVVCTIDQFLVTLDGLDFTRLALCSGTTLATSLLLYGDQPLGHILIPMAVSAFATSVCVCRVTSRWFPAWLQPSWVHGALAFATLSFVHGCLTTDDKERSVAFYSFLAVHSWAFNFVVLVLMVPDALSVEPQSVLNNVTSCLRTTRGRMGIMLHLLVFTALYVFVLAEGVPNLLLYAALMAAMGVIMMPGGVLWCIFVHLPLSFVFLTSSLRLSDMEPNYILATLQNVLIGPALEQAKIFLDTHYTVALSGVGCLLIGFGSLFSAFWKAYAKVHWLPLRYAMGFAHAAVLYMLAVTMHVLSSYEEQPLLHLVYTFSTIMFFTLAFQAFLPFMANTESARELVKETSTIGIINAEDEGGLKKLGLQGLKQVKPVRRTTADNSGLLIKNFRSLLGWQPLVYLSGLRLAYLSDENRFTHAAAVLAVVASITSLHMHLFNTPLALAMDTVAFAVACRAEARIFALVMLVCFNAHAGLQLVRQSGTTRGVPRRVLVLIALESLLAKPLSALGTRSPDDLFEEKLVQRLLRDTGILFGAEVDAD